MSHFINILLAINKAHIVVQRALKYRPGLSGLNQVYGPIRPTPSVKSIYGKYINIFTRCTLEIGISMIS